MASYNYDVIPPCNVQHVVLAGFLQLDLCSPAAPPDSYILCSRSEPLRSSCNIAGSDPSAATAIKPADNGGVGSKLLTGRLPCRVYPPMQSCITSAAHATLFEIQIHIMSTVQMLRVCWSTQLFVEVASSPQDNVCRPVSEISLCNLMTRYCRLPASPPWRDTRILSLKDL
jgi:hypothetical protein